MLRFFLKKPRSADRLTYGQLGINRKARGRSRLSIQAALAEEAGLYDFGKVLSLPFGNVFPISRNSDYFYDLQIEGVGTKTLLAELSRNYDTIGVDGVAMAVNDVLRSGARPILLSDAIHIRKSRSPVVNSIVSGVRAGAEIAGCTVASGETGDVREILHSPISGKSMPFDLFVSCLGVVKDDEVIRGKISSGDCVIGLESSGIHSNGLSLARRVLLKRWGGSYDPYDEPAILGRTVIKELLEPTRIYAKAMKALRKEGVETKAAVHITGDGLAKFWRLLRWREIEPGLGLRLKISRKPAIFELIVETSRQARTPLSIREMFKTFNMGVGFVIFVSPEDSSRAVDSLNIECPAEIIGTVTSDGKISVESGFAGKPVFL